MAFTATRMMRSALWLNKKKRNYFKSFASKPQKFAQKSFCGRKKYKFAQGQCQARVDDSAPQKVTTTASRALKTDPVCFASN